MGEMVEAVAKLSGLARCVPDNPEQEGYHWVRRYSGASPIPLFWNPTWWHNADRGWGSWGEPEREHKWEYMGPIPWPVGAHVLAAPPR